MKIKVILISLVFTVFLILGCSNFKNIKSDNYIKNNNFKYNIINIFSDLYQKELRSVVQIEVFTDKQGKNKQGSGVIISKDGYILTNNHVIENAKEIVILMYDLRDYNATLIGADPKTDVALLKINSDDVFIAAKIGNSNNIKVGEWVITMGSPFGMQNSITAGIISGKNRSSEGYYSNFIQTDAAINPGNSGGPLFNLKGEVIGINTMVIVSGGMNSNVGFAVAINTAMFIVKRLKKDGEIIRGRIGIIVQNITFELKKRYKLASRKGAIVKDVFKDSPADKAGIKVGDIIIEFNNRKIVHMHELIFELSMSPIGKELEIIVLRNNEKKILTVVLEKSSPNNITSVQDLHKKFGYFITIVDDSSITRLSIKNKIEAEQLIGKILISEVVIESSAYLSGLREDDIIVTINTKPIKSVEDYTMAILKVSLDKPFLMTVLRNGNIRYLVLSIKAGDES